MSPENVPVKSTIPVASLETPTFTFTVQSFRITDTRSRHDDTDYVSFTLLNQSAAGAGTPQTLKKSMGDLNNGTYTVGLSFLNVAVDPKGKVTFNYLIVNSGHKSESEIYSVLENAGGSLATKGLTTLGGVLGTAIPIPLLGTLLGAGAGWLVGELKSLLSADCDGPVAAEQDTFNQADLLARTASGPFTHETPHPGGNSPEGCGGNSMYYVTWQIARGIPIKTSQAHV
jgi:hypothetical protein